MGAVTRQSERHKQATFTIGRWDADSRIVTIACATFGTLLDIYLVARAGPPGRSECWRKFAGAVWALSRIVIFPDRLGVVGARRAVIPLAD